MSELPTPEVVRRSISKNLQIVVQQADELETMLTDEVQLIAGMKADLGPKHQRLIAVVKRIHDIVAPVAACRQGCSHCCNMAVTISSHEAELIGKAIGVPPRNAQMNLDQASMVEQYMNVPCTFLKDGECSIYEHRPLPCRTHFNVSSFPQLCDTVKHPGQDVPNLDFRNVWMVDNIISLEDNCTFNDLRVFFPDGCN